MTKRVVVPFDRSAAYWRSRARRHDTPEKRPAAVKLLRKALEKTGDADTALELARLYLAMDCTTAAERYLVRAVARGGLTGEACYLIGCCALNREQEDLAEEAFDACQRVDPDGDWADRAQDALENYPWSWQPAKKRQARSQALCRQAQAALLRGRVEEGRVLAQRAWNKGKSAQAALLMGAMQKPQAALPYFRRAAREAPWDIRPVMLLAMAAAQVGDEEHLAQYMMQGQMLCRGLSSCEKYCAAAWDAGAEEYALALVNGLLEKAPCSVDLLRLKYLCMKRLGAGADAQRVLETLLDLDPDDAAGLWYRRHPEETDLYMGRQMMLPVLSFQLRAIPQRLRYGRLNRLLHWLVMALRDVAEPEDIYRLAVPLWRRMPEGEKRACDGGAPHYSLCLALYVMIVTGHRERADELYRTAPGKKRVRRTLRRFAQWMNEE